MALTDLHVRNAKATGKTYTLGDYDGLSLFVSAKLRRMTIYEITRHHLLEVHKIPILRKHVRVDNLPPYIVPLSTQAQSIVRQMLNDFKPAQKHLFEGVVRLTDRMSANTVNFALKRMGYDGRLTGHGLSATMSTALNEIGYSRVWVDAQLSPADPNRISGIYNHAQYLEQRRVMMQDWANRLGSLEHGEAGAASRHLIVHLQGGMACRGDRTPQRSGVYASYPMDACWQQAMQDPTESMNARIATHTGSNITVSL